MKRINFISYEHIYINLCCHLVESMRSHCARLSSTLEEEVFAFTLNLVGKSTGGDSELSVRGAPTICSRNKSLKILFISEIKERRCVEVQSYQEFSPRLQWILSFCEKS